MLIDVVFMLTNSTLRDNGAELSQAESSTLTVVVVIALVGCCIVSGIGAREVCRHLFFNDVLPLQALEEGRQDSRNSSDASITFSDFMGEYRERMSAL